MSEINNPPASWWWNDGLNAKSLDKNLKSNKARLIAIKSFVSAGKRLFAAVWVSKEGIKSDWDSNFTSEAIDDLREKNLRPVALDVYYEGESRKCAVAWIHSDGKAWGWHPEKTAKGMDNAVKKDAGMLTTIRTYMHNGIRKYSGIWLKNDKRKWDWHGDLDFDELGEKLANDKGLLVSLDTFVKNGKRRYAAVWIKKNKEQTWYWNSGLKQDEADLQFDKFCCFGFDAVPYGDNERKVATIMYQYPIPAIENTELIKISGSATITALPVPLNGEYFDLHLKAESLSSTKVTIQRMDILNLYSGGGYFWETGNAFDPGRPFASKSKVMHPHQVYDETVSSYWGDLGSTHVLVLTRAKDEAGNKQFSNTILPILCPGKSDPPPVPQTYPLIFGNWTNPVEVIPMWKNGKKIKWVATLLMLFNGTGKKMRMVTWHVKMTLGNKVVMDKDLPMDFFSHPVDDFIPINKSADGTVLTSEKIIFFIHGEEIKYEGESTTGKFTFSCNYQLDGCRYGEITIPVKIIEPVKCSSPVRGKWFWGNSPDHTSWDAHAWTGQRFSVDLTIQDENGNTLKDPNGPLNKNSNYLTFNQPVLCMKEGYMIEAVDDFVDENGNEERTGSHLKHGANHVLIQHTDGSVSSYFHLKKDSIDRSFMDSNPPIRIPVGTPIARTGNSGALGSHLHIGFIKPDATGRGKFLPMKFTNLKTPDGKEVKGVPASEFFIS